MNRSLTLLAVPAAIAALLLSGCNKERTPATVASANAELPPSTVVATYDQQQVTAGQVEAKISDDLKKLKDQYEKQKYDLMRQSVEQMVVEDILEKEAKAKGQTTQEYLKSQVKLTPPTDAEVQDFYEKNKDRMPPGSTLEQLKPQISAFLESQGQQKAVRDVIANLRKQHHVKISLPQKRKDLTGVAGVTRGEANAPVSLVEFSDFQCPFCGRAYATVEEILKNYPGKVKLTFVQFPLPMHPNAQKAAEASLCANDQGKFWQLYDVMFKNQTALEVPKLKDYAKQVGLDVAKFEACLDSGTKAADVKKDQAMGEKLGVQSTPTFFVNGLELEGALPYDDFAQAIDDELANSK